MSDGAAAPERTPCQRCGDFAELIDYDGHRICEDCIARLSEIERTPPTVANLVSGSAWVMSRIGLFAAGVVLVADLPIAILEQLVPELPPIISTAWGATISILAQGVVFHMAQRAIRGEPVELSRSAKRAMDSAFDLVGSNFVAGIQILLYGLLFVIPGIVRGLSLALVLPIAVHEGRGGVVDVLRASTERMKGHRITALGAYAVWGSLWLIGLVAYFAFIIALDMASLDGLSDGIVTVILFGGGLLLPMLLVPVMCTTAVLYAKTLKYRVY